MPYYGERAHRLGHVPTINNAEIQRELSLWEASAAPAFDPEELEKLCVPVSALPGGGLSEAVAEVVTVDGSDAPVEVTVSYPSITVDFTRVACSILDLEKYRSAGKGHFVDQATLNTSHREYTFDVVLPGSGLRAPGLGELETWRKTLDRAFRTTVVNDVSTLTLADALLAMHGAPGSPSPAVLLTTCPTDNCRMFDTGVAVGPAGTTCPECGIDIYLSDVFRSHQDYRRSHQAAMTSAMSGMERLAMLGNIEHLFESETHPESVLRSTLFVADGPLATFGGLGPLKTPTQNYLDALSGFAASRGVVAPLLVGIEKGGEFADHANMIRDHIPVGNVMLLTREYHNQVAGRMPDNEYGDTNYYGRRFLYRTTRGGVLVITVPPKSGVNPYSGDGADDFASYPSLRPVCEVLDDLYTYRYENAIIPLVLAHRAASLPRGVGHVALRRAAQKILGLPYTTQIRQTSIFS